MTTVARNYSGETALSKVARVGMSRVDSSTVEATALDVWYGSDVPDLSKVTGPHKKDVLFLVERLTYYNVVPQSRKKALLTQVRQAGGKFEDLDNAGLESYFNNFLPSLQPMQTRHYKEFLVA
jgi:hypothetical protein